MLLNKDEKINDSVDNLQINENKEKKEINKNENELKKQKKEKDIYILEIENKLKKYENNLKENILRTQAEIENIRRRTSLDIEKAHKFALEKFTHELLPVVDSLERALEIADKSNDSSNIIKGIELTLKVLLNTMHKFGVEVVSDIHVPFNPEIHQAMSMVVSTKVKPNHVLMVVQRGYTLNGRLLRPAMVAVSKSNSE